MNRSINPFGLRMPDDLKQWLQQEAKDICDSLGYVNHKKAIKDHIDKEDIKGVTVRDPLGKNPQKANAINESGMYSLVLRSRKAEAKKFKRWVTSEALPQIRKTGKYEIPASPYIQDEQLNQIKQGVSELVHKSGKNWQTVYNELFNYVQAPSLREIKKDKYKYACEFLGLKTIDGELIHPSPQPNLKTITRKTEHNIAALCHYVEEINKEWKLLCPLLQGLKSPFAARMHDWIVDGNIFSSSIKQSANPKFYSLKDN